MGADGAIVGAKIGVGGASDGNSKAGPSADVIGGGIAYMLPTGILPGGAAL